MPEPEEGEWSDWCSNVVCVRTKSSKESENSPDGPVIHFQPIVVRSTYRAEPGLSAASLPRTPSVPQRRRITRLIKSPSISSISPIQYDGVGRVSLSLKSPSSVPSSTYYSRPPSVDFSRPPPSAPFFPSRRRSPVRIVLRKPAEELYQLHRPRPDVSSSSSLVHFSLRDFRPSFTLPSSSPSSFVRASSLPPSLSTAHARRSSFAVPSYFTTSSHGGRSITGDTGNVTSSLRRGSVDVSYLSRGPDFLQSSSYSRRSVPPIRSEIGLMSNSRRGSLSVPRSTYRSSTAGRFFEDELKASDALSSGPETLSSLRTRTEKAKDKLDTHRSLLDRYLPGGSREPSVDNRFDLKDTSSVRRSSVSSLPPRSLVGSRAPSMERSNDLGSLHRTPAPPPPTSNMSPARRRIRNVLYKVSGDDEFLN